MFPCNHSDSCSVHPPGRLLMKVKAKTSTAAAMLQPTQRKRTSETKCKTKPLADFVNDVNGKAGNPVVQTAQCI